LKEELIGIDSSIKVVKQLSSVADSIEWLSKNRCDLIFSDIELTDGLSFSIFRTLDIATPVVFTTAYDQYAIQAFETNSIGYLLKPVESNDLEKVLNKYRQNQLNQPMFGQLMDQLSGIQSKSKTLTYLNRLILSLGNIQKPVSVEEIVYFMADDRYLFAVTQNGKKYYYDATLAQLEKELDPDLFFRANRRYFINKHFVNEIKTISRSRLMIKMTEDVSDEIVVSYSRSKEFKEWIVS
jgi:DNA-binding LytR/AlgR family response regulator